jgi:hypothetical protein
VQAQEYAPSTLIYIVFIAMHKNVARAEKQGLQRPVSLQHGSFPPRTQFHTKSVDKIVSKRIDSMQEH